MIIIPMAGMSSRFTSAGYERPKYELELRGTYVFDYAISRFSSRFDVDDFAFVVRSGLNAADFVRARARALGIKSFRIAEVATPTRGQAESVAIGIRAVGGDVSDPLCIFNIDTFVVSNYLEYSNIFTSSAGVLEVVRDVGSNWSFVEPTFDGQTRVCRTAEKIPISDLCCTGLYWFRNQTHFLEALELEYRSPQSQELYVAPLYNHLIARGDRVDYILIDRSSLVLCGTPSEFEALQQEDDAKISNLRRMQLALAGG